MAAVQLVARAQGADRAGFSGAPVGQGRMARAVPVEFVSRARNSGAVQAVATALIVLLGPILAAATFLTLGPLQQGASSTALRAVFLPDLAYVLLISGLVLARVGGLVAARRRQSAGSELHLRLSGLFAAIAHEQAHLDRHDVAVQFVTRLIAIFYWPGRVVLRVLSKGRYPPAGGRRHDIELVALVGLALFLLVLSVVFG